MLNRIDPTTFDWGVPGLREELLTALIRSLPKGIRRSFSPAGSFAAAALARLNPAAGGSIRAALARDLTAAGSVTVTADDFDVERVPGWLRPTFLVRGTAGTALGQGRTSRSCNASTARTCAPWCRRALRTWNAPPCGGGLRSWRRSPSRTSTCATAASCAGTRRWSPNPTARWPYGS